ncbi:hypothetical protein A4R35_22705 [Thermogemmatispora tikiterensis]|uniref:Uncharacterized protein n=1 Tax=Thermogemmatispora tikiterensis TaxID=1825093 RepID=A0A328VMA5_9CHLR|nr:hypothetical protein A4R35_22705 [Thermogemmatispora tikiterensis]
MLRKQPKTRPASSANQTEAWPAELEREHPKLLQGKRDAKMLFAAPARLEEHHANTPVVSDGRHDPLDPTEGRSAIRMKTNGRRDEHRVPTQAASLQDQAGIGHSPGSTDRSPTASATRSSRQRQNNRHEDLLGETTC